MTTEHSQAETAAAQPTGSRRLTRRSSDRVIAGVAAGVADYLNIDPLLVRAGFAGLMIFGGAGLVLYFVAWLLIPAEGRAESITEAAFRGLGLRSGRLGRALLVFAAVIVAGVWLRGLGDNQWRDGALFAVLIVTLGILLLRWGDGPRPSNPAEQTMEVRASTSDTAGLAPATPGVPVVAQSPAQQRSRSVPAEQRPRESSPLGWFVVAADLVAVGLLAVVDNLPGLHVTLGQYLGAVLAVLGLGLVLGAWWGRARLLIPLGSLLVPLAVTASFVTVPLEGGIGDHEFHPQTIGELRPEYRLAGGDLFLDLSGLKAGGSPVAITASVGIGRLLVIVPKDALVELDASAAAGSLSLFGSRQLGTALVDRVEQGARGESRLILNLEVGVGGVIVEVAQGDGG